MNPTSKDFDVETIETMNEIATLLRAAQEMSSMGKTFGNSAELDKKKAQPLAREVMRISERAAANLLSSLFYGRSKRTLQLTSSRKKHVRHLSKAIENAKILSEMEVEGFKGSGAKGNVIRIRTLEPLEMLHKDWKGL